MTSLWMHIDLTGARGKVPWTAVRSYIRRSKAMLTHATIKNLSTASTPKTLEFLSRCPRLENLELWVSHDCKDFYQKFKGSKKLKSLILSADLPISHDYFGRLLADLPKLERIALWNVKSSNMDLYNSGQWPKYLPNLKSITLASRQNVPQPTAQHMPALSVPDLTKVGHFMNQSPNLVLTFLFRAMNLPCTQIWKNYVLTLIQKSITFTPSPMAQIVIFPLFVGWSSVGKQLNRTSAPSYQPPLNTCMSKADQQDDQHT
jgi:hypothetical protein